MTYICFAQRTAIGSFGSSLSEIPAPQLGATVIKDILKLSKLSPDKIDEVYMGCVLTSGVGQAPARQAAIFAGLSQNTPCTTIGKVCGSGMKSVMLADLSIRAKENHAVIAGGMENMSLSPYLVPKMRSGLRLGNGELIDSMIKDGLWDVYNNFHMGKAAELCVKNYSLTREQMDSYAAESFRRAQKAQGDGSFKNEISPIELKIKKETKLFEVDEGPSKVDFEKMKTLKAAFEEGGTITAANSSTINDGAAALLLCSEEFMKNENLKPMARIVAQASSAEKPENFTIAPASSIQKLLKKCQMTASQIDLWELNEAFAAVALANMKILEIPAQKINIHGGAIALGHPIGASGARILVTLCHALNKYSKKYGVASLCIGGGEATSILVEAL